MRSVKAYWESGGKAINDLHCSPNIVWVIKSRRISRAGHVARMGERRSVYGVLVGKPEGKKYYVTLRKMFTAVRLSRDRISDVLISKQECQSLNLRTTFRGHKLRANLLRYSVQQLA